MLFSSIPFLYRFLPVVLLLYFAAPRRLKNTVLLCSSLFFYAWGEPKFLLFMLLSVALGYVCGLLLGAVSGRTGRRAVLFVCVFACLGLLGFCKYADFFIGSFNALTGLSVPLLGIALPIGISFYTFQVLSYAADVYRGDVPPQKNPIDFAMYITMFPQLIAGPIVRYREIAPALKERRHSIGLCAAGAQRFLIGLGKKVILADSLAALSAAAWGAAAQSILSAWLGAVSFALQIYFDFSGYSDMAIGLGKLFLFRKFQVSVYCGKHYGFLAPLAHFAFRMVSRLSVYPARRKPCAAVALAFESCDCVGRNGLLARRGMEFYFMGALFCRFADFGKAVFAARAAKAENPESCICAACRFARLCAV